MDLVGSTAGKAVDLIGNTADKAIDGARSLIDLDTPSEQQTTGQPGQPSQAQDSTQAQRGSVMQFVDSMKLEIKETVQDFREKGAVATFKDAALDAVDLVGNTATTAVNGAKTVAAPILEDFWATKPEETASAEAPVSPSPAAVSSSAPATSAPEAVPTSPVPAVPASFVPASPSPKAAGYASAASASPKTPEEDDGKQARKSLVSMRRGMFEQKKDEPKEEPKKDEAQAAQAAQPAQEEEEVID